MNMLWQPVLYVDAMSSSDYISHMTCFSHTYICLIIKSLRFAEIITLVALKIDELALLIKVLFKKLDKYLEP